MGQGRLAGCLPVSGTVERGTAVPCPETALAQGRLAEHPAPHPRRMSPTSPTAAAPEAVGNGEDGGHGADLSHADGQRGVRHLAQHRGT